MKKTGALASALRKSGAAVAAVADDPAEVIADNLPPVGTQQPSRAGTKAITVHFPEIVRRQLKALAAEQGRDVADMVAEALNLLFVKYRRPELVPRKSEK
jgi:hypothetical protein